MARRTETLFRGNRTRRLSVRRAPRHLTLYHVYFAWKNGHTNCVQSRLRLLQLFFRQSTVKIGDNLREEQFATLPTRQLCDVVIVVDLKGLVNFEGLLPSL